MSTSHPVLVVRNLRKSKTSADVHFELWIETLLLYQGEFVAVVGASGCGKSTLLDILGLVSRPDTAEQFSFQSPDSAKVDLLSSSHQKHSDVRRQYLGYVLQTGGLVDFLTVKDNIALPALLNSFDGVNQRVLRLARRFGIDDQLQKKPQDLSGGQRQRVAIARAIIHEPILILADEPTAALDSHRAQSLLEMLRASCSERRITAVVVTHDVRLVKHLADRVFTFVTAQESGTSKAISRCVEISSADF